MLNKYLTITLKNDWFVIYKGEYLGCHPDPDQDSVKAVGRATQCLTYPGSTKQFSKTNSSHTQEWYEKTV